MAVTCPNCGGINQDGAGFCIACGAGLTPQAQPQLPGPYQQPVYYSPPQKESKVWLWVTLGVVGLLIAGLLVAVVAIPVFNSAKANAEEGECRDNLRTIDGAIMQYRAYGSGYSTNPDDYVPMYLKEWPTCPTDGSPYIIVSGNPPYARCPNGHSY